MPEFLVTPHQSPMYRSFSSASSQAGAPTLPWTQPPFIPTYPAMGNDIPSVLDGSPVELPLEGFDIDLEFPPYLDDQNTPWMAPEADNLASMDLFTNYLDVQLISALDFGLEHEGLNPFTPPDTVSPTSSIYDPLGSNNPSPTLVPLTPASLPMTGTSSESASPAARPPTQLSCSEVSCTKVFSSKPDLRKHERKHRKPFQCPIPHCGKGHLDKRALGRHLWAKHPDHARHSNTPSERVKCPHCDHEGRQDNVTRHMKRHTRPKNQPPFAGLPGRDN
ncbi:zinc finger protein zas1 [Chaetomidium leptoderma]|uniref:Zinc finger protein zas1 n=1 Tax=Chaetomidium leptoderma TaxID=669021 RepID=A0AAN6VEB8_9PEZI|nr:zinc finger protein zas1 [Chaetomidium leptoderma]